MKGERERMGESSYGLMLALRDFEFIRDGIGDETSQELVDKTNAKLDYIETLLRAYAAELEARGVHDVRVLREYAADI